MNILHDFKALTACAFALLAASCSEEQTSLDVNSFPGKAQIIGSLAYSEGTVLENGQFKELIKPAADKEVCLEISNSAYKTGAAGVTTWKVRTDAQGKFEATLPVPSSSTTVTIKPADFTGYFYSVARENNEYVADTAFVVYRLNSAASTTRLSTVGRQSPRCHLKMARGEESPSAACRSAVESPVCLRRRLMFCPVRTISTVGIFFPSNRKK